MTIRKARCTTAGASAGGGVWGRTNSRSLSSPGPSLGPESSDSSSGVARAGSSVSLLSRSSMSSSRSRLGTEAGPGLSPMSVKSLSSSLAMKAFATAPLLDIWSADSSRKVRRRLHLSLPSSRATLITSSIAAAASLRCCFIAALVAAGTDTAARRSVVRAWFPSRRARTSRSVSKLGAGATAAANARTRSHACCSNLEGSFLMAAMSASIS
mmetsp:Transcript_13072/g.38391  ORF Transcript_13072/g.38391 Transcript_13072/m.38391 type:complete len:212 (+) Transcript_13072:2896-3531(+)